MNPTPNDVHVDSVLTELSLGFAQSSDEFVASKVFPIVPVQHRSDVYYIWDRADTLRSDMTFRAPGSESAGSGFRLAADDPYNCKVRALHVNLDDQTRANAVGDVDIQRDITALLTQDAMIEKELDFGSRYFRPGIWATEQNVANGESFGGAQWNADNATPIQDIRRLTRQARNKCGKPMNTIVFGGAAWDAFLDNPVVVDRFKHTIAGGQTTDMAIATMLGAERVLVGNAIYNPNNEGSATESCDPILPNHVLACYTPSRPSIMSQAAGYTFAWTGYLNGAANDMGMVMSTFRMPENRSDRIEIESAYDHKLVSAECGSILLNVIA